MNPLLAFIFIASLSEVFSEKKVVVLSFDGFRSDYYAADRTPKLWAIKNKCASPKYLLPMFPPKTLATLHTVAVGVHPNKHGVYANEMFAANGTVKSYSDNHYDDLNKDLVPIWIENQTKGGGKSALMMWPGGEFTYGDKVAQTHVKYDEATTWENRAETIKGWITGGYNLVMAYFEDYPLYDKAKLDTNIKKHITKVDVIIEDIRTALPTDYDMIVMSDHGTSVVPGTNVIDINTIVPETRYKKIISGPLVWVKIPLPNERKPILTRIQGEAQTLKTFKVYDKDLFQHDWYIHKLNVLSDVLLLVAEPEHTFMDKTKFDTLLTSQGLTADTFVTLENGYDNDKPDMRALFVGYGPGFVDDLISTEFLDLIDVYPCLKALLCLKEPASSEQDHNNLNAVLRELLEDEVENAYEH